MQFVASKCVLGRNWLWAWAFALAAMPATGAEPFRQHPSDIVGTLSCTAVSCHGGGGPRYWTGSTKGAEYVHWLGGGGTYSDGRRAYDPRAKLIKTDGDPHALAAQRIHEPRFQEVLRRASGRTDRSIDAAMMAQCAKCHDPLGTASPAAEEIPHPLGEGGERSEPGEGLALSLRLTAPSEKENKHSTDRSALHVSPEFCGIGCETCHGGARQWLTVHYQTGVSRDELFRLGMTDTKDLAVRAKLCAGCHIGSVDQDMNHDMIAAGHPPLRFEQASYEALLGRKHWDDAPARSANPNYEVQLWAAGRIAAAEAALNLLEARAIPFDPRIPFNPRAHAGEKFNPRAHAGENNQKPWPEFAESNCLACHQPLRKTNGERIPVSRFEFRGRTAAWQTWNTAFAAAALSPKVTNAGELPPPGSWSNTIEQLRSAMERSAFPDRQNVTALASQARKSLDSQAPHDLSIVTASAVLQNIGAASPSDSWDELCQRLAALAAVRRALDDQNKLNVVVADEAQQRIQRVAAALRFVAPGREWPVVYGEDSPLSTADVLRELTQIRQDLLSAAHR